MNNRFFKVDSTTRFISNITIGPSTSEGYEAVQQTSDLLHIGVGWSLIDGQFSDTRSAYRSHLAAIRQNGSQGRLASFAGA